MSLQSFAYPWEGLEDFLERDSDGRLYLVGYGSLMNRESAALTLPQREETLPPVVASGCRRIFNYRMPDAAFTRYGPAKSPRHRAALNVEMTGDPQDSVNGVVQVIEAKDLEGLRSREVDYRLVSVQASDWESGAARPEPFFILVFESPYRDLLPHSGYVEVCANGARRISEDFYVTFITNSFLADGATRLLEDYEFKNASEDGFDRLSKENAIQPDSFS